MRRAFPWVLVIALVASGCEKTGDPMPVPTPIATPTTTDPFSGTLVKGGSNFHAFRVNQSSEIDVTLTTVTTVPVQADPNADPPVAAVPAMPVDYSLMIRVGQSAITTLGVTCSNLKSVVTKAGPTPQLTGQAISGTFCVAVSDPDGSLPESVTYTVNVAHS